MCLRFAFLLVTRVTTWLRLSRREEAWQTAEILILRHQLAVLQRRQPRLWVPRIVSLPLTWSSLMCARSRTLVSGCTSTVGSGTVSFYVTTTRLPGGTPRLRLARLARPLRPGQGRRDPPPAPPGRRAPAPGRDAEAVLARPGDLVRAGPAAAQRPPPPPAPDHLPAHPAALAVPAAHPREAAHSAGHTGAGTGDGTGQPGLGIAASTVS